MVKALFLCYNIMSKKYMEKENGKTKRIYRKIFETD